MPISRVQWFCKRQRLWSQKAGISTPALPMTGDVTFGKLFTHATPAFSPTKQGQPHLTGLLQELNKESLFIILCNARRMILGTRSAVSKHYILLSRGLQCVF